ncbi:MAG: DUF86 domain-containing protein [Anaerolineales bacterium]|jgi:uncharacterized protein with HEPN domain|nr:DUF86 domain-containing protein [Anaerolineales bacterium]
MDYEIFEKDDKTVYAVIRAIEIIGEAASKLPKEFFEKYPELPWREIIGMRNKLVHAYFGIKMAVIWQTIQEDLPLIAKSLAEIIEKESNK